MAKLLEADDYFMHSVVILFLLINFSLEIGIVYLAMALIDWMAYYLAFDKSAFNIIPLEKDKRTRFQSLVWAMGAYVAFIFIANFIVTKFTVVSAVEYTSTFEYISALVAATFSATPILYGSTYLKLAVWGILIPIVETRFFFRTLLQWAVRSSHIAFIKFPTSPFSKNGLITEVFFGAVFTIFHIMAKGISNNSALMVTFLFGVLSAGMVIYFKQLTEAIFLHIITNTIATMQQLRIGFFEAGAAGISQSGIMILGGVMVAAWFLMFQEFPFLKPRGVGA